MILQFFYKNLFHIIDTYTKILKKISQKFLQISLICDIIYKRSIIGIEYRGVAQLVARVVWDHEVAGSIPVTSTN